ncbi:TRAF3-interacting protein 1 [Gonapodya sp. JEL0774]|nr:TRAF3-interacting protein 1 [Gonapodya sp. JEL0774]
MSSAAASTSLDAAIKSTQSSLAPLIKRTPLTAKLLTKPPFRFLHDLVSEAMGAAGWGTGLFSESERNSENVKEKEAKIAWLMKLSDCVSFTLGEPVRLNPNKVVAGMEPEVTNEFLQQLARATQMDSTVAVKRVTSGERPSTKHSTKSPQAALSNEKDLSTPPLPTPMSAPLAPGTTTTPPEITMAPPPSSSSKSKDKEKDREKDRTSTKDVKGSRSSLKDSSKKPSATSSNPSLTRASNPSLAPTAKDAVTGAKNVHTAPPQGTAATPSGSSSHRRSSKTSAPTQRQMQQPVMPSLPRNAATIQPQEPSQSVQPPPMPSEDQEHPSMSITSDRRASERESPTQDGFRCTVVELIESNSFSVAPPTVITDTPDSNDGSFQVGGARALLGNHDDADEFVQVADVGTVLAAQQRTDIQAGMAEVAAGDAEAVMRGQGEHGELIRKVLETGTGVGTSAVGNTAEHQARMASLIVHVRAAAAAAGPLASLLDLAGEDLEGMEGEEERWKKEVVEWEGKLRLEERETQTMLEPIAMHIRDVEEAIEAEVGELVFGTPTCGALLELELAHLELAPV